MTDDAQHFHICPECEAFYPCIRKTARVSRNVNSKLCNGDRVRVCTGCLNDLRLKRNWNAAKEFILAVGGRTFNG